MIKSARFTLRAFSIVPLDITSKNGVFFVRLPIADYSFTRYTYKGWQRTFSSRVVQLIFFLIIAVKITIKNYF